MLWPFAPSIPLPANTLKTVFVEQAPEKNWEQPWQDACEEASLLTAIYYKQSQKPSQQKIVNDLNQLFIQEDVIGFPKDINLDQMGKLTKHLYKYDYKVIQNPSLETLKHEISHRRPVIVPANGKTLFKENKNFKNGGPYYHNVTILGFDDNSDQFIVHDVGTRKGEYFRYSYQVLMDAIHDLPESGDKHLIENGEKRVLVLI